MPKLRRPQADLRLVSGLRTLMMRNEVAELIGKCERQIAALAAGAKATLQLAVAIEASQRLLKIQLAQVEARNALAKGYLQ